MGNYVYDDSKSMDVIEQKAIENAYKLQSQREQLERQLKARLEEVINSLQENTRFRYKLLEHPTQIIDIKNKLCQEFDGKAKEALDERIQNTYNLSYQTNVIYNIFINRIGMK